MGYMDICLAESLSIWLFNTAEETSTVCLIGLETIVIPKAISV